MSAIRSILVGIDFSSCSAVALAQAIRLARIWGSVVHPVHVIDTIAVTELEEALAPIQKEIRGALLLEATQAWKAFAAEIDGASALSFEVAINNRVVAVLESAQRVKADLIVLGAFSGVDPDLGIGTTASACVRRASGDVLLAREDHRGPYGRIVVGIDFSETSRRALEGALLMANSDGAELHVLHVFTPPWLALHWRSPTEDTSPAMQHRYRGALEERLREFSAPVLAGAAARTVHHHVHDHEGHRSGIVEYAMSVQADLIVVGTRGRTNLRDILLGSTAEKTLRDCSTSVLAVRPRG